MSLEPERFEIHTFKASRWDGHMAVRMLEHPLQACVESLLLAGADRDPDQILRRFDLGSDEAPIILEG
jgi:hypothetical protein